MKLTIDAVGLLGPGLTDWTQAAPLLAEPARWQHSEVVLPPPAGLPPAERRRVGQSVRLAMAAAAQAVAYSQHDAATLPSVFTSSAGDGQNCHILCEALTEATPQLSPTRFTNSVHNAPSGYWSIATACQACSTSICGFDGSFAAGLLEAGLLAVSEGSPVLLVAYDVPYPAPLAAVRAIDALFATALILNPTPNAPGLARLHLHPSTPDAASSSTAQESTLEHAGLNALRLAVPAARSLPLLSALARRESTRLWLPTPATTLLAIDLEPV